MKLAFFTYSAAAAVYFSTIFLALTLFGNDSRSYALKKFWVVTFPCSYAIGPGSASFALNSFSPKDPLAVFSLLAFGTSVLARLGCVLMLLQYLCGFHSYLWYDSFPLMFLAMRSWFISKAGQSKSSIIRSVGNIPRYLLHIHRSTYPRAHTHTHLHSCLLFRTNDYILTYTRTYICIQHFPHDSSLFSWLLGSTFVACPRCCWLALEFLRRKSKVNNHKLMNIRTERFFSFLINGTLMRNRYWKSGISIRRSIRLGHDVRISAHHVHTGLTAISREK